MHSVYRRDSIHDSRPGNNSDGFRLIIDRVSGPAMDGNASRVSLTNAFFFLPFNSKFCFSSHSSASSLWLV